MLKTTLGEELKVGDVYEIISPVNSPYITMHKDIVKKHKIKDITRYKGRLIKLPSSDEPTGTFTGTCLYFEVIGTDYPCTIAEPVDYITGNVTKILKKIWHI